MNNGDHVCDGYGDNPQRQVYNCTSDQICTDSDQIGECGEVFGSPCLAHEGKYHEGLCGVDLTCTVYIWDEENMSAKCLISVGSACEPTTSGESGNPCAQGKNVIL